MQSGGLSTPRHADVLVRRLLEQARPQMQNRMPQEELDHLEPVLYITQVVNGINYFIKAHVGRGNYVHLKLYENLMGEVTFENFAHNLSEDSELKWF